MNSLFGTAKQFECGQLFEENDGNAKEQRALNRQMLRQALSRTVARFSLALSSVALAGAVLFSPVGAATSPVSDLDSIATTSSVPLKERLARARQFLDLTQEQTARLVGVSPSSLEKFEQGRIAQPNEATVIRYSTIIKMADLYRNAFGDNPRLVTVYFKNPSPTFGDVSPLEYALKHPSTGLLQVYGMQERMFR